MPTYHYRAATPEGKKRKGFIEAESRARAFSQLREQGLLPMSLEPAKDGGSGKSPTARLRALWPGRGVRLGESFYYLALLLQSGSSLAEALDHLGRMSGGRTSKVWYDIRDNVEQGEPFSKSLAAYPKIVPKVYVGMVQVAESAGRLGMVLERIAEQEERRAEVGNRLATAMVYPAVILLVGMGAVYFLLTKVMPNIARIFEDSAAGIPASTKFMLTLGTWLSGLGPLAFIPPLLLVLGMLALYRRGGRFRVAADKAAWGVPLVQKGLLARFSGMLGFQLEAGIPLVRAMENAAGAVANLYVTDILASARKEVSGGRALDQVLSATGAFPELYILTLSTGAKAGKLGPFLLRLANIYDREVDNALRRILALVEPALILVIGLVVAFIVMSIMGPIFDLSTLVH